MRGRGEPVVESTPWEDILSFDEIPISIKAVPVTCVYDMENKSDKTSYTFYLFAAGNSLVGENVLSI